MKTNEATVFVFIASIIIGLMISMNIEFGEKSKFLDVHQYEEAYNQRNKLYSDLSNLKEQYYKSLSTYEKYKHSEGGKTEILTEVQKEIDLNKLQLGTVDVFGEGIRITLNDAEEVEFGGVYDKYRLVHDTDIVSVVNDLQFAGAEAISVNGQRVMSNTSCICAGSNIDLSGVNIVAPFYINAIGNKNVLKNYIDLQNNHVKQLIIRNVRVKVEVVDNIKISGYIGNINYNYMKESKLNIKD